MKLSLMIFLMFCIVTVTNSQWYQQTIPENISLNSVFMVDENIAYAVGGLLQGDFIKTIDGGSTWHVIPSFTDAILHSVYFLDSDTGFVGGQFGQILKTTDGGFSWMFSQTETNQVITDIDFVDDSTGFACGTGGLFLKTIDGGTNWEKVSLPNNAFSFSSLDFIDAKIGFVIGSPSYKTTDGGLTWQEMTFQSSPTDIFMIDAQIGFVSKYNPTTGGGIYRTENGGDTVIPGHYTQELYQSLFQVYSLHLPILVMHAVAFIHHHLVPHLILLKQQMEEIHGLNRILNLVSTYWQFISDQNRTEWQ
ncbi:MAG: hypothetical protein GXO85_07295 [Chlorobi bacterium]|nr:hypothetical protein [Chlorobiota bacterium]